MAEFLHLHGIEHVQLQARGEGEAAEMQGQEDNADGTPAKVIHVTSMMEQLREGPESTVGGQVFVVFLLYHLRDISMATEVLN